MPSLAAGAYAAEIAPAVAGALGGAAMRFKDLEGLTSLPIAGVRQQFRNEDVISVLPVRGDGTGRDSLLVATPSKLAILTREAGLASDHWMTHWAPWDAVRLVDGEEAVPEADEDGTYRLAVHVGGRTFQATLSGPAGKQILVFIVAVGARHEALTPSP
jgi:hypothetical protein